MTRGDVVVELAGYEIGGETTGIGEELRLYATNVFDASECPAVAGGGGRVFAAYRNAGPQGPLLTTTMSAGARSATGAVEALQGRRGVAAAASDGTRFLVVAPNEASSADLIAAQRFDADGQPLDTSASGIVIASVGWIDGTGTLGDVAAAGSPDGFLVTYVRTSSPGDQDLWGVLVASDGTASPPRLLHDGEYIRNPAVAAGPGGWLVAWEESALEWSPVLGGARVVAGLRVGPDGAPLGAPFGIAGPDHFFGGATVASDGATWLVAWNGLHHDGSSPAPYAVVLGARVGADGTLLDGPATGGGFRIAGSNGMARTSVTVGFTGARYVAAFELDHPLDVFDGVWALPLGEDARSSVSAESLGTDVSGNGAKLPRTLDCATFVTPDAGAPLVFWREQQLEGHGNPGLLWLYGARFGG
jgi:hypothetical protein